jgi:hypothetical protein
MNRFKAFSIHLGVSLGIFIVLLLLIVFVWYPQPYFAADGGWQGIRIIAGVDLVIGPLLTLIVFKPGKPGLKFDLTAIALAQTLALVVGVGLVYGQRTAMVVFADGEFYSLNHGQIEAAGAGADAILRASAAAPAYAYVRTPEDKKALLAEKMKILGGGSMLFLRGDLYAPMDDANRKQVLAHGLDIVKLGQVRPSNKERLDAFLAKQGRPAADFAFLPLHCRYADVVLVLSRADGKIVDSLNIDPGNDVSEVSKILAPA